MRVWLAAMVLAGSAAAGPLPRPVPPGPVCGEADLVGVEISAKQDEGGCGIAAPVRLSAAAGVGLDPPATLGCDTALALAAWLTTGPKAIFGDLGERLEGMAVADAYSCRGRNRVAGAKLSEHAFGRAIDISAFRLGDGSTVTVRNGWTSAQWAEALRRIRDAGCGPFGTVLGPEANPLHADHLHLDVARRRSGPYCE